MANTTVRTFRGIVEDKPLTHAERRKVIEAPWPAINVWGGKAWGGTTKRESLIPESRTRSWDRAEREAE
jgi:hypothetical protein